MRVLGADYPVCAHDRCEKAALDGYCLATCCSGSARAFCSEHSHRATHALELLGHAPNQERFTRSEVERIVKGMWAGAGLVFENMGHFRMVNELKAKRASDGVPEGDIDVLNPR